MSLRILTLLLIPLCASASNYKADLARIQLRQKAIDKQLAGFGISPESRKDEPGLLSGLLGRDEKPGTKLYQIHESAARLQAAAGKLLFGRTLNRLVVGAEVAPVVINLNSDQGSFSGLRVLGKARQSGTTGRLQIDFDRVIFRTGKTAAIKALALDEAGAYGLEAQVFSSKAIAVAGAMASSFISGVAASQQTLTPNAFGFSQVQPTGRNAILQGVAQTAADQSKRLIEDATQEKPVLVVEADTPVSIYVDEEVRF